MRINQTGAIAIVVISFLSVCAGALTIVGGIAYYERNKYPLNGYIEDTNIVHSEIKDNYDSIRTDAKQKLETWKYVPDTVGKYKEISNECWLAMNNLEGAD